MLFYTARDGDNPLKLQLHRVGLDGRNDRRLTDPAFHHTVGNCIPNLGARPEQPGLAGRCSIAPDNAHFVDVYQTHDTPPAARIVDAADGARRRGARAGPTRRGCDALGCEAAELFTFTAADGKTHAARAAAVSIAVRSGEDRIRRWCRSTAGRSSTQLTARETFVAPSPLAEYGFLDRQPRLARGARARQAHARRDLPEARTGRDRRHGRRRQGAVEPAVRRQGARRHLRHLVRRLCVGDGAAAPPRGLRRRVVVVAADRLAQLRHDLHRALHVDCRRRTRPATTPAAR